MKKELSPVILAIDAPGVHRPNCEFIYIHRMRKKQQNKQLRNKWFIHWIRL